MSKTKTTEQAEPSAETRLLLATAYAVKEHLTNHRQYHGTEMLTRQADAIGAAIEAVENPVK